MANHTENGSERKVVVLRLEQPVRLEQPELPRRWIHRHSQFLLESLRTILFAIAGSYLAVTCIRVEEHQVDHRAEVDKAEMTLAVSLVNEFLDATSHYADVAADACRGDDSRNDLLKLVPSPPPPDYLQAADKRLMDVRVDFIDASYDRLMSAKYRLRAYFPAPGKNDVGKAIEPLETKLVHLENALTQVHDACIRQTGTGDRKAWEDVLDRVKQAGHEAARVALAEVGFRRKDAPIGSSTATRTFDWSASSTKQPR